MTVCILKLFEGGREVVILMLWFTLQSSYFVLMQVLGL